MVDAHNPQSQFWGLAAAVVAGVSKRISTVHSVYSDADRGHSYQWLYQMCCASIDFGTVVVSQEIEGQLRALGVRRSEISLVTNGIELNSSVNPRRLREQIGWGADTWVIGIVGRLSAVKGHEYLFRAIKRIRPTMPRIGCLVVGEGPLKETLVSSAKQLGVDDCVYFTGFQAEPKSVMAECDIICQPSLSEGLPFSVLESASIGKPMVLSAVGGLPSHFVHRETVCFVPPGDSSALASELEWCFRNPTRVVEIGAAGKDLVRTKFGLERMFENTFELYDFNVSDS